MAHERGEYSCEEHPECWEHASQKEAINPEGKAKLMGLGLGRRPGAPNASERIGRKAVRAPLTIWNGAGKLSGGLSILGMPCVSICRWADLQMESHYPARILC